MEITNAIIIMTANYDHHVCVHKRQRWTKVTKVNKRLSISIYLNAEGCGQHQTDRVGQDRVDHDFRRSWEHVEADPSVLQVLHGGDWHSAGVVKSRAGYFRYFLIFSIIKMIFGIFYQVNNPISAPVLFKKPSPSQINFIKNAKKHFLLLKKLKNTERAQLWL